jgi:hypothetical protein
LGDSLFGIRSGAAQPVAVANMLRAEERRFSRWRTTLLGVAIVVSAVVGLGALILASPGAAGMP